MVVMMMPLMALLLLNAAAHDTSGDAAWLDANGAKDGVVTLPSGLQYKVIATGDLAGPNPTLHETCKCHYTGALVDGTVFDSSRERGKPAHFAPYGVISGWTEALQLMRPGDRWQLFIPARLGYGSRGAGRKIPGGATLVFDLELLAIEEGGADGLFGFSMRATVMAGLVIAYALWSLLGASGGGGKKVSASHILVKEEELCKKLKELFDGMASSGSSQEQVATKFAEMATSKSTCPSSKSGGSLGTFSPGQMVPAFDQVCWSAPVGVVQGPVATQFGFHLILVTERNDDAKID